MAVMPQKPKARKIKPQVPPKVNPVVSAPKVNPAVATPGNMPAAITPSIMPTAATSSNMPGGITFTQAPNPIAEVKQDTAMPGTGTILMAKGGMTKKGYVKGGVVKANCGASMKPAQGKWKK